MGENKNMNGNEVKHKAKGMYASFKQSKWFPLVIGILSIILGLVCVVSPQIKMESIAVFFGFVILIYGIFEIAAGILTKDNAQARTLQILVGIVASVLAILVFANLSLIGKYLPTMVGFFMILRAGTDLFRSLVLMQNGFKNWWAGALPAVIVLILGFVFLLKPGFVGQTFGIFAGVSMIISGASAVMNFFMLNNGASGESK